MSTDMKSKEEWKRKIEEGSRTRDDLLFELYNRVNAHGKRLAMIQHRVFGGRLAQNGATEKRRHDDYDDLLDRLDDLSEKVEDLVAERRLRLPLRPASGVNESLEREVDEDVIDHMKRNALDI